MIKENKTKTLQIRIGEEDYNKLCAISFMMGTKPSAFARQLIQMSINASKLSSLPFAQVEKHIQEGSEDIENNETDIKHLVG